MSKKGCSQYKYKYLRNTMSRLFYGFGAVKVPVT